jgi:alkylation response protein AidB-like acyl-CoA dehydrogenase
MNVLPDEQERSVRDAAREFLSVESPPKLARAMERDERGYPPELWARLAELGWLGISLPEEYGGQGLPLTYTGLLLGEIGRHITPVPLHSTTVAALAIAQFGKVGQKQRFLPGLASGEQIGTFAFQELSGEITPGSIQLQGTIEGDALVLNGTKAFVDNFNVADLCVVVFRTETSDDPREGIGVAIVDTSLPGLSITPLVATAKDRQFIVHFDDVRVPLANVLGEPGNAWGVARGLFDQAVALLCAQLVGAARRDMEMAVDYSKQRHAFGRPIGSFQALQHLEADMLNAVDGSELLTYEAIWRLDAGLPASVEVSQAKAFASERCIFACRASQQIHGGIGFMQEFDLQLWYRRVASWALRLGSSADHRERLEKTLLDGEGRIRLGETLVLVE